MNQDNTTPLFGAWDRKLNPLVTPDTSCEGGPPNAVPTRSGPLWVPNPPAVNATRVHVSATKPPADTELLTPQKYDVSTTAMEGYLGATKMLDEADVLPRAYVLTPRDQASKVTPPAPRALNEPILDSSLKGKKKKKKKDAPVRQGGEDAPLNPVADPVNEPAESEGKDSLPVVKLESAGEKGFRPVSKGSLPSASALDLMRAELPDTPDITVITMPTWGAFAKGAMIASALQNNPIWTGTDVAKVLDRCSTIAKICSAVELRQVDPQGDAHGLPVSDRSMVGLLAKKAQFSLSDTQLIDWRDNLDPGGVRFESGSANSTAARFGQLIPCGGASAVVVFEAGKGYRFSSGSPLHSGVPAALNGLKLDSRPSAAAVPKPPDPTATVDVLMKLPLLSRKKNTSATPEVVRGRLEQWLSLTEGKSLVIPGVTGNAFQVANAAQALHSAGQWAHIFAHYSDWNEVTPAADGSLGSAMGAMAGYIDLLTILSGAEPARYSQLGTQAALEEVKTRLAALLEYEVGGMPELGSPVIMCALHRYALLLAEGTPLSGLPPAITTANWNPGGVAIPERPSAPVFKTHVSTLCSRLLKALYLPYSLDPSRSAFHNIGCRGFFAARRSTRISLGAIDAANINPGGTAVLTFGKASRTVDFRNQGWLLDASPVQEYSDEVALVPPWHGTLTPIPAIWSVQDGTYTRLPVSDWRCVGVY